MTIFYILLLYVWKYTFYEMKAPLSLEILIWAIRLLKRDEDFSGNVQVGKSHLKIKVEISKSQIPTYHF